MSVASPARRGGVKVRPYFLTPGPCNCDAARPDAWIVTGGFFNPDNGLPPVTCEDIHERPSCQPFFRLLII